MPLPHLRSLAAAAFALAAVAASAATYHVNSIADLQARIASAVAGDTIVVANGVYTTSASITVNRAGAAGNPITIAAETVGSVEIRGSHGFGVSSPAAYVVIQGFTFSHTAGRNSINNGATFVRFTRNTFQCSGDGAYLVVAGHDAEIDRNEFRDKNTVGNMIDVRGSGSQIARRVWIHHNYFHDFRSPGANGAETIRFGLSGLSLSDGHGLIEYNLFVRANGENEMISNKSSSNTYRYNTVIDCPGAQLTLRHGNDCVVYGNYFKNTEGIRIFGDRHQVHSNYLEGNSIGINLGNGDGEVANGAELTAHDRPDHCVITFNTLVNNTTHYEMSGRTNGLGATNTTFANNVIQGGATLSSIRGPNSGATWAGNLVWNVGSLGDMPAGAYVVANPLLAADASGLLRPQAGSPAIDSAEGSYSAVTFDLDGQPRSGAKDKGADEVSNASIAAQILTVNDVGPASSVVVAAPEPPALSHVAGTYAGLQYVSLATATTGATIRYTTDGSTPSASNGALYSGLITIESTTTIRAIAVLSGAPDSSVTSATFIIDAAAPRPGRLVNLSTRGFVPPGGTLTPGFYVGGPGGAEKSLVIRAIGPRLVDFGVTTALSDTKLDLVPGGASAPMMSNDDWNVSASSAMDAVGAFALVPNSKDAVALPRLGVGSYSVRIAATENSSSGIALAEVYDADDATSATRLVNLSTLGFAGTGENVLTVGFFVGGTQPKQLLIRAIGPGLAVHGIGDHLADPQLAVIPLNQHVPVAASDDWGTGPSATALAAVFAKVAAFELTPGSKDAALVVQLAPGGYSVAVSGADGTTGQAIVEIYDLDP